MEMLYMYKIYSCISGNTEAILSKVWFSSTFALKLWFDTIILNNRNNSKEVQMVVYREQHNEESDLEKTL